GSRRRFVSEGIAATKPRAFGGQCGGIAAALAPVRGTTSGSRTASAHQRRARSANGATLSDCRNAIRFVVAGTRLCPLISLRRAALAGGDGATAQTDQQRCR